MRTDLYIYPVDIHFIFLPPADKSISRPRLDILINLFWEVRKMSDIQINHLTGEMGVTEKIKKAMYEAAKQFVYIGFLLWETKEYEYHKELNYDNVYDYAAAELGFKRTSTKNFIAICENFCERNKEGILGTLSSRFPTMRIKPEYKEFNYSQLTEMLSMSAAGREQVTSDMTVKQIRDIKSIDFKKLDKLMAIGQTSDHIIDNNLESIKHSIISADNDVIAATGPGHTEACAGRKDLHSVVINNLWCDLSEDLLLKLIKVAGLKKTKNMCYDIEIKVHKDN